MVSLGTIIIHRRHCEVGSRSNLLLQEDTHRLSSHPRETLGSETTRLKLHILSRCRSTQKGDCSSDQNKATNHSPPKGVNLSNVKIGVKPIRIRRRHILRGRIQVRCDWNPVREGGSPLVGASNLKLLTIMAALEALRPTLRIRSEVVYLP